MAALTHNERAGSPILLVCEHASNYIPPAFAGLGLPPELLEDHVAWDIGALGLARRLAEALDAPLIAAPASRLLVDPNRDMDAPDLIPSTAEGVPVPGNQAVTSAERAARCGAFHAPFHQAIEAHLERARSVTALVAVHSFTPALFGVKRPWHAGILHGPDARLADVIIEVLSRDPSLVVGRNEPYAPAQGVFYTMDRHAGGRATAMIEVRNDLIRDEVGQGRWADKLAVAISEALASLDSAKSEKLTG